MSEELEPDDDLTPEEREQIEIEREELEGAKPEPEPELELIPVPVLALEAVWMAGAHVGKRQAIELGKKIARLELAEWVESGRAARGDDASS